MTIDYDKIFESMDDVNVEKTTKVVRVEDISMEDQYKLLSGNEWKKEDKAEELVFFPKTGEMKREITEVVEIGRKSVFDLELAKSRLEASNINELLDKAEAFVVETDQEAKRGVAMAMQARKMRNSIEKSRKAIVRPHLDFNKAVKKYADEFTLCLTNIEKNLIVKIDAYQDEREKLMKDQDIIDSSLENISVEDGSSTIKLEWNYVVEDISHVPNEYITINEKAVKDAIKKGIRNIPGVSIFETKKRQYRIKK